MYGVTNKQTNKCSQAYREFTVGVVAEGMHGADTQMLAGTGHAQKKKAGIHSMVWQRRANGGRVIHGRCSGRREGAQSRTGVGLKAGRQAQAAPSWQAEQMHKMRGRAASHTPRWEGSHANKTGMHERNQLQFQQQTTPNQRTNFPGNITCQVAAQKGKPVPTIPNKSPLGSRKGQAGRQVWQKNKGCKAKPGRWQQHSRSVPCNEAKQRMKYIYWVANWKATPRTYVRMETAVYVCWNKCHNNGCVPWVENVHRKRKHE